MFVKTISSLVLFAALTSSATAAEITTRVQNRNARGGLSEETLTLRGLKDPEPGQPLRFESDFFKIVKATDEVAISVDADPELKFKAATAYHHLHKARDFFVHYLVNTEHLNTQTTIRIEMDQDFSNATHFREPERLKDVRNIAFTVAASDPDLITIDKPWNAEIWFMKAERIVEDSVAHQVAAALNTSGYKSMLAGTLLYNDLANMAASIQARQFLLSDHLISMAFSLAITSVLPTVMDFSTRFIKKIYYFDSVLVPEAIHHEMGHVALRPWLANEGSTPITEGFPNFFAGEISGLSKIMAKGGSRIKGFGSKKSRTNLMYSLDEENGPMAAHGSFTYSLLTHFNHELGTEGVRILAHSLKYLRPKSNLKDDLSYAVQRAAREVSADPAAAEQAVRNVIRCRFATMENEIRQQRRDCRF